MTSSDKKNISSADSKHATDEDVRQICVCPHCNKKIRFKAKYAGKNTNCPGCKQPIVLNPIQEYKYTEHNRTDRLSLIAGWTTSIVFHGLLLLSFAGVTWQTGIGKGGEERDVRIIVEDPGFPEYSDVDLTSAETPAPELTVPSPADLQGDEGFVECQVCNRQDDIGSNEKQAIEELIAKAAYLYSGGLDFFTTETLEPSSRLQPLKPRTKE
jgi:hypothetical protein